MLRLSQPTAGVGVAGVAGVTTSGAAARISSRSASRVAVPPAVRSFFALNRSSIRALARSRLRSATCGSDVVTADGGCRGVRSSSNAAEGKPSAPTLPPELP